MAKDWHRIASEAERARDNALAQLEYEQSNRRKNDAEIAHERDDFIKELETANADLRAALVAIQELHPRVDIEEFFNTPDGGSDSRVIWVCGTCEEPEGNGYQEYPCATRRLADDALGGGQDA